MSNVNPDQQLKIKGAQHVLPAYSAAKHGEAPKGFCLEVVYDDGEVTRTPHLIPYDPELAQQAKSEILGTPSDVLEEVVVPSHLDLVS